jgi:hypothetical protein
MRVWSKTSTRASEGHIGGSTLAHDNCPRRPVRGQIGTYGLVLGAKAPLGNRQWGELLLEQ